MSKFHMSFDKNEPENLQKLPSVTASLTGILKDSGIGEEDYQVYLEEKFLHENFLDMTASNNQEKS